VREWKRSPGIVFEVQDKAEATTAVRKAFQKTVSIGKLLTLFFSFTGTCQGGKNAVGANSGLPEVLRAFNLRSWLKITIQ
jgi:hypothetical protein